MELANAIKQLAGTDLADNVGASLASVLAVNADEKTCTVRTIGGVSPRTITALLMVEDDDGFWIIPAVDSTVIIVWANRMQPYVAMFSEVDTIHVTASNKVVINEGAFGGLVKVNELVTRLNNMENAFNLLNAKVNTLAPMPTIPNLTPTRVVDVENPDVTHGGKS